MKSSVVWIPAVFILGGLVGRFGPAEELRAYRQSDEAKDAVRVSRSANGFDSFAALANIPTAARRSHRAEKPQPSAVTNETAEVAGEKEPVETNETEVASSKAKPRRIDPEDLRARIDEAADLWRTRVEIKRATTIAKLGLDEKGVAAFDESIANMNAKLRDAMQAMADQLSAEKAEMTPELGVRLMGDLSIALAETYDAIGATVGEAKRGEISRLQLYEFVDPSAAEPLIAVQDRLDISAMRGRDDDE